MTLGSPPGASGSFASGFTAGTDNRGGHEEPEEHRQDREREPDPADLQVGLSRFAAGDQADQNVSGGRNIETNSTTAATTVTLSPTVSLD